jgi:hypothetical protein
MKLADGKRHVWPTLASMVYLKDGTTPLADEDGKITADNALNADKLGGKAPEYYVQPLNLLDNSDWRNPVNQRGQDVYNAAGYNLDRWFTEYARPTVTVNSGYVTLKNDSDTYKYNFWQKLPFGTIKAGQKYTCALKTVEGIVYRTTLTAKETDTVYGRPTSDAPFEFSIRKNASGNFDAFTIYMDSLCTLNIEWFALYEGEYTDESLPPYVPKENEFIACLKYAKKIKMAYMPFVALSDTAGYASIELAVPMRIENPSISIENAGTLRGGGSEIIPTNISVSAAHESQVIIRAEGYFAANTVYEWIDFTVLISADL